MEATGLENELACMDAGGLSKRVGITRVEFTIVYSTQGVDLVKGNCPVTGETVELVEDMDRIFVEHPTYGRYAVETDALPILSEAPEVRKRIADWIAESRSHAVEVPELSLEYVQLFERLTELDRMISEWNDWRQKMRSKDEERLWTKLRMEWNYNSNHIEGNTLTYQETELLLLHDRTSGGHPLRDYEEMKAHNVAIEHTRRLAGDDQLLSEGDVRDLNKILLKEPFWQPAITPDCQPTRKRIIPGQYKTQPNHVRTASGALHRFAEPEETPQLMAQWIRDFRRDLARNAYPLPMFLAQSHWSLLRIHPFDDGNGRTARLLANYVLLRNSLLPIVIKSAERDRYLGGLQNADTGRMLPLTRFMLDNVIWSLDLGIRAAKGESIRESEDIDKEMELFIRNKKGPEPDPSDVEVLDQVYFRFVSPIIEKLDRLCERYGSELFNSYLGEHYVRTSERSMVSGSGVLGANNWANAKKSYLTKPGFALSDEQHVELGAQYRFSEYTGVENEDFDLNLSLSWDFYDGMFAFEVTIDGELVPDVSRSIPYSELHDRDADVDNTVDSICRCLMAEIDRRSTRDKNA